MVIEIYLFPELIERAQKLLMQIMAKHSKGSILLVSHGDFGKMLYAAYYNIPWRDMLTQFHFGNCELLLLSKQLNPNEPHVITIEQHN